MSCLSRNRNARSCAAFYWTGVFLTVACLALILAGNAEPVYRFEHTAFPLAWGLAGAAVLAFLAAEFRDSPEADAEELSAQPVPEWESVEA
jgi:hypothetical protein